MENKVLVTPLYGAGASGALSTLLEVHGVRFLLDCGWNDAYNPALLAPLIEVLPSIDAVLLSHPDTAHLGALPYLVGHHGLRAPIYATSALQKMGQMFLYDQYLSHHATSDFGLYTLDDVDEAFRLIICLKYHQNMPLTGNGAGFLVTPFLAGHLLGGALWRITTPQQEQLLYAVDLNQRRERHLAGCRLDAAATRPLLLITDATASQRAAVDTHKRDRQLLDAIMDTLRGNGNVLIPVDTAGRVLELLLLLEEAWAGGALRYPLLLLSAVAPTTLRFARSQLEWMSDSMARAFQSKRDNPFHLRHVRLCSKREQVDKMARGGKLVLATLSTLEAGPSRQLLFDWGPNPANLIVLLDQAPAGTAAAALQAGSRRGQGSAVLRLQRSWRVPLAGAELDAWREEREKAAAAQQPLFPLDSDDEDMGIATRLSLPLPTRASVGTIGRAGSGLAAGRLVGVSGRLGGEAHPVSTTLLDGFIAPEGAAAPLFPFEDEEEDMIWDAYGCVLEGSRFQPHSASSGLHAEGKAIGDGEGGEEEEEEEEEEDEELPTKIVTAEATLTVRARVLTVDMEGRADGRSLRTMLTRSAPRHLVLLQGTPQGRKDLKAFCERELAPFRTRVYTPESGEVVDVSAGCGAYQVVLTDSLMEATHMRVMTDAQLGWLRAILGPAKEGAVPELIQAEGAIGDDAEGGVFIGDVRLSELKVALANEGMPTEFLAGGGLLCVGCIAIRRDNDGTVLLEGPLCENYYRVRSIIYDHYHVC